MEDSIFLKEIEDDTRVSYSNVMETIPDDARTERLPYKIWSNKYKTEWRWRFFEFQNGVSVAEISYLSMDKPNRLYYNNKGEWVERELTTVYDDYLVKSYYYYTDY